jgi:site-specific recombinase XerD
MTMTPLRRLMMAEMELRGYAERTIESYVYAVSQLAAHYRRSPDRLEEQDIRQYLLFLVSGKKVSRSTFSIALAAIRLLCNEVLGRGFGTLDVAKPRYQKTLPVVLTRQQVWRVLGHVRIDVYRLCLTTIYVCGLRLTEGCMLKVSDIDAAGGVVRIRGKGGRHRDVPLPVSTLKLLRLHWRTHRSPTWLFPAVTRHGNEYSVRPGCAPITRDSVQSALRRAVKLSGINRPAHVHTLRHCYATHLLEDGVKPGAFKSSSATAARAAPPSTCISPARSVTRRAIPSSA